MTRSGRWVARPDHRPPAGRIGSLAAFFFASLAAFFSLGVDCGCFFVSLLLCLTLPMVLLLEGDGECATLLQYRPVRATDQEASRS